jgi:flagellar L-ring protein precursor FlgH
MLRTHALIFILSTSTVVGACTTTKHIQPYEPRQRDYLYPVDFEQGQNQPTNGSLFNAKRSAVYLFADHRAMHKGDIVTVKISERADAKRGASTDLTNESDSRVNFDILYGLIKSATGAAGAAGAAADLFRAGRSSSYTGSGQTTRSEKLTATVPAIVNRVLPNGNLFIEGHRVVLVNNEEHHFYISGVVRPVDIQQDNSVESKLIADAEIEFTGRGVISDKQDSPWLHKGLDRANAF